MPDARYRAAFLDWLACAARGADERAARAASKLGDPVAAAATAGHVLDFDDTYLPGIAHLSAGTAPVALTLAQSVGEALDAYAAGFEAMGALARASHPALYDHGLHPTAVCGGVGAAVVAARLLGLTPDATRSAIALALLGAGGLRAAFGSDGKSLQVGWAAAAGVRAARLAAAGARVPLEAAARGFAEATGGRYAEPDGTRAIDDNWIKAWPCCLQTHGPIEAASRARATGAEPAAVVVHPVSLQAAAVGPDPSDGLEAKFSIPYLVAYTLLHGPPTIASFAAVDSQAALHAATIEVRADAGLLESEARLLSADGHEIARVEATVGSPGRPLDEDALARKFAVLGGERLAGVLDDPGRPIAEVRERAGL